MSPATPFPFRPAPPRTVGLLGGIAAGKSAVTQAFAAHGLCAIDADRIAHSIVRKPEILAQIRDAFGPGVLDATGHLDRKAMAARAFADPAARRQLEAITHPAIRAAIAAEADRALADGRSVLLDVPLLLEGGLIARCDAVVFVHASEAERIRRAAGRGWDTDELRRREAAQAPLAEKRARAAFVVDNDGPPESIAPQVAAILRALAGPRRPDPPG